MWFLLYVICLGNCCTWSQATLYESVLNVVGKWGGRVTTVFLQQMAEYTFCVGGNPQSMEGTGVGKFGIVRLAIVERETDSILGFELILWIELFWDCLHILQLVHFFHVYVYYWFSSNIN